MSIQVVYLHADVELILSFGVQGTRDPLQKNSKRAAMLQALCSNVTVKYLEAGLTHSTHLAVAVGFQSNVGDKPCGNFASCVCTIMFLSSSQECSLKCLYLGTDFDLIYDDIKWKQNPLAQIFLNGDQYLPVLSWLLFCRPLST